MTKTKKRKKNLWMCPLTWTSCYHFFKLNKEKKKRRKIKKFLSLRCSWTWFFCMCVHFPFPTSFPLITRSAWLPVESTETKNVDAFVKNPEKMKRRLSFSTSLPILLFQNFLFSLSSSLLLFPQLSLSVSKTLNGPPVCSAQLPDWQRASRKWGRDWLLWDSAGVIRSFNTSRCLSCSRLSELFLRSNTQMHTAAHFPQRSSSVGFLVWHREVKV